MRSVKPNDLAKVIAAYNGMGAGQLTPAGRALVNAGLFSPNELVSLGGVTRTIAAPPAHNVGNGSLRTFDLTVNRPIKFAKLGDSFSVEPSVSIFNAFNMSNFGTVTGNLDSSNLPGTANGTDSSYSDADQYGRNSLRVGNGSGVFSQGTARVIEYGLKLNF